MCSVARLRGLHEEMNHIVADHLPPGIWLNADAPVGAARSTNGVERNNSEAMKETALRLRTQRRSGSYDWFLAQDLVLPSQG